MRGSSFWLFSQVKINSAFCHMIWKPQNCKADQRGTFFHACFPGTPVPSCSEYMLCQVTYFQIFSEPQHGHHFRIRKVLSWRLFFHDLFPALSWVHPSPGVRKAPLSLSWLWVPWLVTCFRKSSLFVVLSIQEVPTVFFSLVNSQTCFGLHSSHASNQ